MPDERPLTPADPKDLAFALAHALQFDGRRHFRRADTFMAEIVAEHLMQKLAQGGFVVMKKAPEPTRLSTYGMSGPLTPLED